MDEVSELEKLRSFSPLRRCLLAKAGTLLEALSALFGTPVTVDVVSQDEISEGIERCVNLVCSAGELVVCRAVTHAQVTNPEIRRLMLEREVGLGQITAMVGAAPSFALDEVGQADDAFWRMYRLSGDGFLFRIHEMFPNPPFERLERQIAGTEE